MVKKGNDILKRKDAYYHIVLIVEDENLIHGVTYALAVELPNRGTDDDTEEYVYQYLIDEYDLHPINIRMYLEFDTELEAEAYALNENTKIWEDEQRYFTQAWEIFESEIKRIETLSNLCMRDLMSINSINDDEFPEEKAQTDEEQDDKKLGISDFEDGLAEWDAKHADDDWIDEEDEEERALEADFFAHNSETLVWNQNVSEENDENQ